MGCFDKVVKVLHKISMLNKKEMPKKLNLKVNNENVSKRPGPRIAEKQNLPTVIKASFFFLVAVVIYYCVLFLTTEIFVISNKRTYPGAWRRSGVFIVNFEHISHLAIVVLLLTLNR